MIFHFSHSTKRTVRKADLFYLLRYKMTSWLACPFCISTDKKKSAFLTVCLVLWPKLTASIEVLAAFVALLNSKHVWAQAPEFVWIHISARLIVSISPFEFGGTCCCFVTGREPSCHTFTCNNAIIWYHN